MNFDVPQWLLASFRWDEGLSPAQLLWRFSLAFLLGYIVTLIYRFTYGGSLAGSTFPRTLVLLTILIAMVTQVIGDNVARAFSLVGALSIVRFRTVVQDTQDTAFVIFAVALGMAAGANQIWVALTGMLVAGVAAFWIRPLPSAGWSSGPLKLIVRLGLGHDSAVLQPSFQQFFQRVTGQGVSTVRQGQALELSYQVRLQPNVNAEAVVSALNRIEGVQGVEMQPLGEF